jgi:hypothetical protein
MARTKNQTAKIIGARVRGRLAKCGRIDGLLTSRRKASLYTVIAGTKYCMTRLIDDSRLGAARVARIHVVVITLTC